MKHLLFTLIILGTTASLYGQTPIDNKATKKTKNLLLNLHQISQVGIMFGHQDDQAYGVGWRAQEGQSDVKISVGQYPAVHGWDVGKRLDEHMNIDSVDFEDMQTWMIDAFKRGGLNTISFHMDNMTTGSDSWDTTPSVLDILPGGRHHEEFLNQLNLFAEFLKGIKKAPVVFRPWHEHNGGWFWWGRGNCSEQEYIQLFRFTVDYLKNEKKIHHLLYAFSPDRSQWNVDSVSTAKANYFYGYPGDDYVDIIGLDNYADVGRMGGPDTPEQQQEYFLKSLQLITEIAKEKNKVAALTETGLESVANPKWFTEVILDPIKNNPTTVQLAWVLVWRNANLIHHYVPYPGHISLNDFTTFEEDNFTIFEDNLGKSLYKKPLKK